MPSRVRAEVTGIEALDLIRRPCPPPLEPHRSVLFTQIESSAGGNRQCNRCQVLRDQPRAEWPGLAADIDRRRDIANAILADQSGADHGEAARRQQPTRLLPRSRAHGHATALRALQRHNQAMSHTSATVEPSQLFTGCDTVTAGKRQGVTRQQFLAFAHVSRWRN